MYLDLGREGGRYPADGKLRTKAISYNTMMHDGLILGHINDDIRRALRMTSADVLCLISERRACPWPDATLISRMGAFVSSSYFMGRRRMNLVDRLACNVCSHATLKPFDTFKRGCITP